MHFMETKHFVLTGIVIVYVIIVYYFSRLGKRREIGTISLFWISLFLTPLMGMAFFFMSQHKKINLYTEERYKCDHCKYVFSEEHEFCPMCEKEGRHEELKVIDMFMT